MMIALFAVAGVIVLITAAAALVTAVIAGRVTRALPPTGLFLQTRAGGLHVVDKGSGPPLVLIHGLGGQIGTFSYGLIDRLATRYRVVAIDRPGSGYSAPLPRDLKGVRRHAEVIAEALSMLKLEPAFVVGHSLGGAVALALALDHPDRVRGLGLIAPLTAPETETPRPFRGLVVPFAWQRHAMAHTFAIPLSMLRGKETLQAVFGPEAAPRDFGVRGLGLLSLRPQAFVTASTDLSHAVDDMENLRDRYPAISIPVSVLFGQGDQVLDPDKHGAGLVASLPATRLTVIEGGHMIPVTQPERVAAFIDAAASEAFS